jgi:translation initiation factor IF-1
LGVKPLDMDKKSVEGQVVECRPNSLFLIQLPEQKQVLAYLGGKMRFNHVRVLVGDIVEVELDPYNGKATNRIVRRK